jgi:tetrahydromethanopterin S-methyltransferase subunit G
MFTRINAVHADLLQRLEQTNRRIDTVHAELAQRIDAVHSDLIHRVDETNDRLNRLYEVIVRRDEHEGLGQRLTRLEQKVEDLAARVAA